MGLHVAIRPIVEADLPTFFEQQSDPEAVRMVIARPRTGAAFFEHWAKVLADPTVTHRAILADGALAGMVNAFDAGGHRWVGYWLGREWWGRGVATRGLGLLLAEEPARPLHARAARSNVASIRVLERNGFVLQGYAMGEETERFPACEEARFLLG